MNSQPSAFVFARDDAIHMVAALDSLRLSVGAIADENQSLPADGSRAKEELKTVTVPEMLITAYALGSLHIEAAGDHLMAFCRTVTEPVLTIAPWTCVRGVLEASALAMWVFDPSIRPRERIKRCFAFRYEGLRQEAAVFRCLGDEAGRQRIQDRIREVEADARKLHLPPVLNRKGELVGIGQAMPSITDLVKTVLDAEVLYRMLSGATHAHAWALRQLSFQKVPDELPALSDARNEYPSLQFMTKALDTQKIVFLCVETARVFARPVWYHAQLYGWDTIHLARALDTTFDHLHIRPQERFWRAPEAANLT